MKFFRCEREGCEHESAAPMGFRVVVPADNASGQRELEFCSLRHLAEWSRSPSQTRGLDSKLYGHRRAGSDE